MIFAVRPLMKEFVLNLEEDLSGLNPDYEMIRRMLSPIESWIMDTVIHLSQAVSVNELYARRVRAKFMALGYDKMRESGIHKKVLVDHTPTTALTKEMMTFLKSSSQSPESFQTIKKAVEGMIKIGLLASREVPDSKRSMVVINPFFYNKYKEFHDKELNTALEMSKHKIKKRKS